MATDLTEGEKELLIDGFSDDVAFDWVLIRPGLRGNPPSRPGPPTDSEVGAAFEVLDGLSRDGLVEVGRLEYIHGGPPGRVAPVKHVEESIDAVKARVLAACGEGRDWEWACWVVNTPLGNEHARRAIASR